MTRSVLAFGLVSLCIALLLVMTSVSLPAAGKPSPCPADVPVNIWVAATGDPAPAELGGSARYQMGTVGVPYNLVPDSKGSGYTSGKGSLNIDAHFQLSNCTGDLSINLSTSARTLTAYLQAADKGNLSVWWFLFDKAWGTPTPANRPPTGLYEWPTTDAAGGGGDFIDADGHYYYQRTMGSMGNDVANNDSRLPMSPNGAWPLSGSTSYVRVYHPTAEMWVLAPELTQTGTEETYDWIADLVRLKASGSYVWDKLQPYRFKIVVCKTTAATCNVGWPN